MHAKKNTSEQPNIENEYSDLISRLERLDSNLSQAIAAKQILLTSDNDEVIKSLDNTYEAHACQFLLSAARNELILALRRILEPESKDKCCFRKLIKIRKKSNIEEYINRAVLSSPNSIHKSGNTIIAVNEFEVLYEEFEQKNADLISDIRVFRDYHLAHTLNGVEQASFRKEKIIYAELFQLLDDLCNIFENFTRLVKNGCWDNTSKNNIWKKYSLKFWESLSKGVITNNE